MQLQCSSGVSIKWPSGGHERMFRPRYQKGYTYKQPNSRLPCRHGIRMLPKGRKGRCTGASLGSILGFSIALVVTRQVTSTSPFATNSMKADVGSHSAPELNIRVGVCRSVSRPKSSVLWNVVDSSGGDPRANIACHVSSTHQKNPARKLERNEWSHHGNGLAFWNIYVCSEAQFLGH